MENKKELDLAEIICSAMIERNMTLEDLIGATTIVKEKFYKEAKLYRYCEEIKDESCENDR